MERAKEAARGQTLPIIGGTELCWLPLMGTDHMQHAPAPAWQTRVQTASTRVRERGGQGFHLLRCLQIYSWSLQTYRHEPLTFRKQRRDPSACGSSSRKERFRLHSGVVSLFSSLLPKDMASSQLQRYLQGSAMHPPGEVLCSPASKRSHLQEFRAQA